MTDDQYVYRWQDTAHRILGELISEGRKLGLPPLTWTLATSGALTGQADGLTGTVETQRAAVTAWADHLGATVTETPRNGGRISLSAPLTRGGERHGIIRAELFLED
ncbi:hypothetical protein [Streptomyces sp. NPDC051639]|uniref:hypothetical protein n=1 Tax=Streptomyces TaxID=1883 RepID=UPI00341883FC